MNAARLNFSHGTHEEHAEGTRLVREIEAEIGRPIAVIADLQGPKVRIGELSEPVTLERGDEVVVAAHGVSKASSAGARAAWWSPAASSRRTRG